MNALRRCSRRRSRARSPRARAARQTLTENGVTDSWFGFETAAGRGTGHLRLKDGLCWTLLTTLQELKGYEEKAGRARERGVDHGVHPDRLSWLERRQREQKEIGVSYQPFVLIVGGGQGGLALGARLKRLGVPALIIEKNERAGDSWLKRYRSLVLHDPVWYDHMPYLPYPDHWPIFTQQITAPPVAARAYHLVDALSGQVLAAVADDDSFEPASLTKLMTAYLVFGALRDKKLDPIPKLTTWLIEQGLLTDRTAGELVESVKADVDRAAEWAESRPVPDASTVMDHLYGNAHATPPAGFSEPEHAGSKIVLVDAQNRVTVTKDYEGAGVRVTA